jgi:1-acyl-sn-glycerol-3-phosphate acyltransferase
MAPEALLGRDALIEAIVTFLAGTKAEALEHIREALGHEIDRAGPAALVSLNARLAASGVDWEYYPPDPLARRIHHVLADRILETTSELMGLDHLAALEGEPVVIFANHLSYSDANLLEVLLVRAGARRLADRLTAIAGPKVYSSGTRRFSSLCFGTIKVAQSAARSSGDAVMSARDVARAARRSIDAAHDRLGAGDALLVFAEGARSRTRGMQRMLPGAARYVEGPDAWVLPVGITGTEAMFPIGEDALHPVRVVARVGPPLRARALRERAGGDRRVLMDTVGTAIAALLPPEYRGIYELT